MVKLRKLFIYCFCFYFSFSTLCYSNFDVNARTAILQDYLSGEILYEKDIDKYLNIEHFGSTFLKDCNKASLNFHEISKDVNKPTNNSASLIQQI